MKEAYSIRTKTCNTVVIQRTGIAIMYHISICEKNHITTMKNYTSKFINIFFIYVTINRKLTQNPSQKNNF